MTIHVDYLQAGTYTAAEDRYAEGASLVSAGGVTWRTGVLQGDSTELKVAAQSSPNMTVKVSPGQGICPCSGDATAAPYTVTVDATTNVTISASDPTNARKDLIVLTVRDAFYSGANNDAILQVITGTPAPSPTLPATPINSIALAEVDVAASATSISNGNIIDLRTYTTGRGGVVVCTSSTRPSSLYAGLTIFETDTKLVQSYDGTTWQPIKPGAKGIVARNLASQSDTASGSGVVTVATTSPTLENGRLYKVSHLYVGTVITNTAQSIIKCTNAGGEMQRIHSAAAAEAVGTQIGGNTIYTITGTGASVTFAMTVQVASGSGSARTLVGTSVIVEDIGT